MRPGDYVTSTIRLARPLAQGGMGSVWLAEHLTLQIELVVKFCLTNGPLHPHLSARFQREAALAMRARSPHVVQIFDHGLTSDGTPYIAMELLRGEDLATRLDRDGRVHPVVFSRWLTQAAEGLAVAHAVGVVHRDIKPSNLFLCHSGDEVLVKVLDFGIAKNATRELAAGAGETVEGSLLGTLAYMSPEQIRTARDVDFRTDLWALGVVAYHALTGERPFRGDAVTALAAASAGVFVPVTQVRQDLPKALDAWMATALAVDPAARFPSAQQLAAAFAVAVGAGAARGRQPPRALQQVGLGIGAGLMVSAFVALGAYFFRSHAAQPALPTPDPAALHVEPPQLVREVSSVAAPSAEPALSASTSALGSEPSSALSVSPQPAPTLVRSKPSKPPPERHRPVRPRERIVSLPSL